MELTIDQALQKAVDFHKTGQLQEANRLYTAILKSQPKHPDANHNMGVLAVRIGKVEEALPFFKTALEANFDISQFWLSYIDALIRLNRLPDAKALLDQAKIKGTEGVGFDRMEKRLNEAEYLPTEIYEFKNKSDQDEANVLDTLKLDQALKLANKKFKKGLFEEAKRVYEDILKKFPKNKRANDGVKALSVEYNNKTSRFQGAEKDHLQRLIDLFSRGQFKKVLDEVSQLLENFPNSGGLYNISGAANWSLGQLGAAIENYEKALAIKPDYAEVYNNLGLVLKEQGKLEKALEAFSRAVSIKPDTADAHYNMGNTLKEIGQLEEAVDSYNKSLSIKPDHAQAFNNKGLVLKDQGNLVAALEAYKKALSIKPNFSEVWNNIVLPLQVMATQMSSPKGLASQYLEVGDSKHAKIAKSILNYRLSHGGGNSESALNGALTMLASIQNISLKKPTAHKLSRVFEHALPEKIVTLVHFGRSGTGLLHSLIDGHPQVSTFPGNYLSEFYNHSTWEKIISGGSGEIVDRFMAIYDVLFDATSIVPIETKGGKLVSDAGRNEGMTKVGDKRDKVLSVDKNLFRTELNRLIKFYDELDIFLLFRLAQKAYDKACNDQNEKKLIFYHIHNPDTYAQLNFVRSVPNANWVMMIREPIQSCESWLKQSFFQNDYTQIVVRVRSMLFELDNIIYHKQNSIGVRLEDLKERPRETIPALCKWMGIEETESLYEMTAQGKKWWGDPSSPDYSKDGMDPFGKTSINRKVGSIFSANDQYIFRTLFYPFSVRFGYVEENLCQFWTDLQSIKPMLHQIFDFEKMITERTGTDPKRFMNSGPYLYLRSGLVERWKTLNEYQTYPNMIKPLKIG